MSIDTLQAFIAKCASDRTLRDELAAAIAGGANEAAVAALAAKHGFAVDAQQLHRQ